jgi:hypothetical protein
MPVFDIRIISGPTKESETLKTKLFAHPANGVIRSQKAPDRATQT